MKNLTVGFKRTSESPWEFLKPVAIEPAGPPAPVPVVATCDHCNATPVVGVVTEGAIGRVCFLCEECLCEDCLRRRGSAEEHEKVAKNFLKRALAEIESMGYLRIVNTGGPELGRTGESR